MSSPLSIPSVLPQKYSAARRLSPKRFLAAFTMIELLATIAIIAVLAGLVLGGYGKVLKSASQVREMGAAKTLIMSYTQTAIDNNGTYLAGYDRTLGSLALPDGTTLSSPQCQRYPYRLAPYFNNDLKGTILVNDNLRQVSAADTYFVSLFPAFGMNYIFVGGDAAADGTLTFPTECLTRQSQAASILVFATAAGSGTPPGGGASSGRISGYCILTPPNETTTMWSSSAWTQDSDPSLFGNVDARYNGYAICAFLDGSVRRLSINELRDMRLWNRNALAQNNPNYLVTPTRGGGRL